MPKVLGVKPFEGISLKSTYLLLINPDKIPHLVFIQNGEYYSLTAFGSEIAKDFNDYLEKLKRLKKKMLFIELNSEKKEASAYFKKYLLAASTQTTCFVPIKEMILPSSKAEMVFELIPDLYENQLIANSYHIGLEDMLNSNGEFELITYTKEMIFSYIEHLKNKDARRNKN